MAKADFWNNQQTAQLIVAQLSCLKAIVEPVEEIMGSIKDLAELLTLAEQEADEEMLKQLEYDLAELGRKCDQIELQGLLCGDNDAKNCFFSIHAGAGGTESCDWANMLLRMYRRYFEINKYKFQELDIEEQSMGQVR